MQENVEQIHSGGDSHNRIKRFFASPWVLLCGLALISGVMFFARLDSYPMQNWDEGIHSQVTKEMVETGDIWTLHYQGGEYFRKPPLKIWLTAPLVSLFGDHNWTYRFWSALAGVGSTVLLAWFVYKKEGSIFTAWLAGGIFASGQFIYYHAFRTGEMDGLLIFFLIAGLYAYWKAQSKKSWFIWMGVFFGVAVMSKSIAGVVGPLIVFVDILLQKKWSYIKQKYFWYGILAFGVVVLPWHISMFSLYGSTFWNEYIGFHVVDRTFSQLYADLPSYWYVQIIFNRLFPLSIFLLGALFIAARDILRDHKKSILLTVVWFIVPLLLYTWVKTKFEWYILPVYPAVAWLVARYLRQLVVAYRDWLFQVTAVISAVMMFAMIPGAIPTGAKTYWFALQAYMPSFVLSKVQNSYILAVVFVSLVVWLLVWSNKRNKKVITIVLVLFALYPIGFAFGRTAGMIATQPQRSVYQDITDSVTKHDARAIRFYETDMYDKPAGYFELYRVTPDLAVLKNMTEVNVALETQDQVVISSTLFEGRDPFAMFEQYYLYE